MGERKSFWRQFKENTEVRSRAQEEYENMLEVEEERKKEPTVANLTEVMEGFDIPAILSSKMNINDIYEALQRASQDKSIDKLELVVTQRESGEVDECFFPGGFDIWMVADGVHIHTVYCIDTLDAGFVSAIASRRRINTISRCKVLAEYLILLIEETAPRGTEQHLPESFAISENIRLNPVLLDHTKFKMGLIKIHKSV